MSIERKISILGKGLVNQAVEPSEQCFTLEEHALGIGPQRHLKIKSPDEVIHLVRPMGEKNWISKTYSQEAINSGKLDNSGDIFSKIFKVSYTWKPSPQTS